ncbi:MAG: hypothetical protein AB7T27_00695 [Kiritimatiellia bacterium]
MKVGIMVILMVLAVSSVSFAGPCCAAKAAAAVEPAAEMKASSTSEEAAPALCGKCGQVAGSELCCKEGAAVCPKCGKHAGSPGCMACCKSMKAEGKAGCPMMEKAGCVSKAPEAEAPVAPAE